MTLSTVDDHVDKENDVKDNVKSSPEHSNNGECATNSSLEPLRSCSQLSERVKRKSWYNVIYPSYKSRSETFKKLFKEVPDDERLIIGKTCEVHEKIPTKMN